MSSYRGAGGDSFRPNQSRGRRDSNRDFRRRTSPDDSYLRAPREPPSWENRDSRRDWSDRRDRDPQAYDRRYGRRPSSPYDGRDYRDRDRAGYRSPPRHSSRSRSRSRSPRRRSRSRSPPGGRPTREVKLSGVPGEITESDIRRQLKLNYNVRHLEDIQIIRGRKTSFGYAFLTFPDVDKSQAFMDQNSSPIRLETPSHESGSESAKVEIAYNRQDEETLTDWIWKCTCGYSNWNKEGRERCAMCFAYGPRRYRVSKSTLQKRAEAGNTDASPDGTPSQYLLVRGLEPGATEEVFAKGIEKLYKGATASEVVDHASSKPKAKVISTTSTTNLGAPKGSLRRVLLVQDSRTEDSWRYGFAEFLTVEDAKAAMAKFKAVDAFTISSKPVSLAYAHAGVFVPAKYLGPGRHFRAAANPEQVLQYWHKDAYVSELAVASPALPPAFPYLAEANADPAATLGHQAGPAQSGQEKEIRSKKRKAEGEANSAKKKTIPSHLQFWQDRSAELHGIKSESGKKDTNEKASKPSLDTVPSSVAEAPPAVAYGNPNNKCCYLCRRKFETISDLNKHERLSAMHREKIKDTKARLIALALVRKFVSKEIPAASQTPLYRDRAAERRQAYNQPKKAPIKIGLKKKQTASTERSSSPKEATPAPSKGASLLGKMGYVEGQGLGVSGEGRTAPIETDMYRQGVGLGAEGSKVGDAAEEASRNTRSNYAEFLEKTREKAQERYNSLKETK